MASCPRLPRQSNFTFATAMKKYMVPSTLQMIEEHEAVAAAAQLENGWVSIPAYDSPGHSSLNRWCHPSCGYGVETQ